MIADVLSGWSRMDLFVVAVAAAFMVCMAASTRHRDVDEPRRHRDFHE